MKAMTNAEREAATATALVDRAKAGDGRAFEELVRRYRKRIFALALHMTASPSDADDIVQEVFLKAYRALDKFEGRSEFFTWVYRMAVNRSLNALDTRRRRRAHQEDDPIDDPRIALAVEVDVHDSPHSAAVLRQTYARLLHALDSLPADMRTTVILVALQGMAHGEAAVIQKVPEGTISWRMHEARRRLREAMGPERVLASRDLSSDLASTLAEHGLPLLALPKRA
jgi:RNA polymerase sigma-70 factor (ECF subfamily)